MPTPEETATALQDEANAFWDELGGGMRDWDGFQVGPSITVDGVQLYQLELWGGARTTLLPPDDIREAARRYLHSRLGREPRPRRKPPEPEESKPMNAPADPPFIHAPLDKVFEGKNYRQRRPANWYEKLEELAGSIRAHGVIEPIVVRPRPGGEPDENEVVVGDRRWRAARIAGLTTIPATVRALDDAAVLDLQVAENNQREDPHPLDEADGFKALVDLGRTPADIAARLGRDVTYVHHRLKLCGLSKKCRQALDDEYITLGVALLLARLPTEKLQDVGLEEVTHQGLGNVGIMSVAEARKALEANVMLALKSAPFKRDDATLVPKAGPCTTCPKRTGTQLELYADASSPDLCTDPGCYREKVDAVYQLRVKKHKADGGDVLSQKDARALLGNTWTADNREIRQRFVKLDERVYDGGKSKTVKALFKGELPAITLAKDPDTGLVVELVDRKLADKAKGSEDRSERSKPSASEAAANRRERLKDQARKEATRRCIAAIVQKVEALVAWEGVGETLLRPLAFATLEATWHDGRSELAKRRGWLSSDKPLKKPKNGHHQGGVDITVAIENASARELAGVIVELIMSRGAPARWQDQPGYEWDRVAEALGVDYQAVHANVVEEQRAAEKAKAKPAKKAKAKKVVHLYAASGIGAVCGAEIRSSSDVTSTHTAATCPKCKPAARAKKPGKLETKARRLKKAVEKKLANGNGAPPAEPKATPGVCKGCGCTENAACEGGCHWVDADCTLCSKCADGKGKGRAQAKPAEPAPLDDAESQV